MAKPRKIFYVEVLPGGTPLRYRQKGGGIYVQKAYALSQKRSLEAHGAIVRLYEIDPVEWKEVI